MTNGQYSKSNSTKTNKTKKPKITTDWLIKEIAGQCILFHDQYDEPWLLPNDGRQDLCKIGSKRFKRWLGAYVYHTHKFALKNNQVRDITEALGGIALYEGEGEKHLEARSCLVGDSLWYDLGGSAVKITQNGWGIIEQPPILFRRYSHQEKQVIPAKDGNVQLLRQFVNIGSDEDWALFLVFAISAFIPTFPKPVLVLTGSQGAGKTTPMRMLKKLIDPSALPSNGSPSDQEEMSRMADRHSVIFFDNLSSLSSKVSDLLCKLVTGDGFSRRTKFTDDDETIFVSKRTIMMNGINSFITRADLLDRTIILEIERIAEDKRLAEDELWQKFEAARPKILGGIFDVLSRAMALYDTCKLEKLPRMADFAKWGVTINEAIKQLDDTWSIDFLEAYEHSIDRQNDEAIQANPVAVAAQLLVKNTIAWEGTATEFFEIFESSDRAEEKYLTYNVMWPKDPSGIGRALSRAETNLRRIGYSIEHYRQDNKRMIRIFDENRREEYEARQREEERKKQEWEQAREEQRHKEEEQARERERQIKLEEEQRIRKWEAEHNIEEGQYKKRLQELNEKADKGELTDDELKEFLEWIPF